jgi:hypothetical protein
VENLGFKLKFKLAKVLYKAVNIKPDFVLHQTEDWLVFPYEMSGLTLDEIKQHKPYLVPLINEELIS